MPVFRSGAGQAPGWCELEFFEIVDVPSGASHTFERCGEKEKLIVTDGSARIRIGGQTVLAEEKAILDLAGADEGFAVEEAVGDCKLVRMCGRWGDEVGGSGVFGCVPVDEPRNAGDPLDFPSNTTFDNHYHDCDEYWIILEGGGTVFSEGKQYEVEPGDCVATGMGHHHHFPQVTGPMRGVYFETTMEGNKRPGHLWNHTHGQAEPKAERV